MLTTRAYITATVGYGMIRKAIHLKDATIEKYDSVTLKHCRVPLLLTDKVVVTGISGLIAVYGWPVYLFQDIQRLELKLRSIDPEVYLGKESKRHLIDYMFN